MVANFNEITNRIILLSGTIQILPLIELIHIIFHSNQPIQQPLVPSTVMSLCSFILDLHLICRPSAVD